MEINQYGDEDDLSEKYQSTRYKSTCTKRKKRSFNVLNWKPQQKHINAIESQTFKPDVISPQKNVYKVSNLPNKKCWADDRDKMNAAKASVLYRPESSSKKTKRKMPQARVFACEYCGRTFTTGTGLYFHTAVHTGEWKHTCDMCNKGFMESSKYQIHMRTHQRKLQKKLNSNKNRKK